LINDSKVLDAHNLLNPNARIGVSESCALSAFRWDYHLYCAEHRVRPDYAASMKNWLPASVVGLLVVASVMLAISPAGAADHVFISVEVEEDPAGGCQADNVGSPGPELRTATDALDDAWQAAALGAGYMDVQEALLPPAGLQANPVAIMFPFASGIRTVTVTAVDVVAPAPGSGDLGSPIVGNITISTGLTLQDCSPKPAHIYDAGGPHWTEAVGSGASRDGVLFAFDTPVRAFGAWFGDLETRPEAEGGVTALVKLFDSSGSELLAAPIDTSTADTSVCGGPNSSDLPGCGNGTTRWIGFVRDNPDVASMLVIVGDDDTPTSGGAPGGLTEHLSWAGAQLALAPALLDIAKTADVAEADIGGVIEYSISVTNTGDEPATNLIITDTPDLSLSVVANDGGVLGGGQITWTIPLLAGGSSATVSYSATVAAFNQAGYVNVASVESDTTVAIEDSVTVAARYADLSITKAAVNMPDAGEDLVYEFTVSNAGVSPATGVTITDTTDAPVISASGSGWTCDLGPPITCDLAGSLLVGETNTTLVVTVATAADSDSVVTNVASVSSDLPDPDESDNEAAVAVSVTTTTTTTLPPSTTTTTTTLPPSTTTTTTTTIATSTTATTTPGQVGGGQLPETGITGLHAAAGLSLIGVGIALLSGARLLGATAARRAGESRDG